MKIYFAALFMIGVISAAVGQSTGTIRGKVIDDATGEELIGVTVLVAGTTKGAVTDLDGTFQISLAPGTYDLQISFVSFETVVINELQVKSGEVTLIDGVRLKEAVEELEAVVVTADVIKNSETALLTVKRKSANLLDGISAQNFRKVGDSDAASAARRVTGVSVQGGKYVYVRGLGDRYTKSILNGMDIPGLDPDRNSLQMDIFPTNIIDNLVVFKSFTTDLPADFTGGVVNIETKDFPEEKTLSISASVGFNPSMHFKNSYLTYEGSRTDWLGFDNGSRDLPVSKTQEIPLPALDNPQTTEITRKFNPTLSPTRKTSPGNLSMGVSGGDQRHLGSVTLGYNGAFSYRNTTEYYDNVEYNSYLKPDELNAFELRQNRFQRGQQGSNSALLSGLVGFALKTNQSKIRLNLMHIQNGESRTGFYNSGALITGSWTGERSVLEYSERAISNLLLAGEHVLGQSGWKLDWKVSPTKSSIEDKDIRTTPFRTDGGSYEIEPSESGDPTRIWRNLDEINWASRADATKTFELLAGEGKVKFGVGHTYKQRDYEILNYRISIRDPNGSVSYSGDPDQLLQENFIWTPETDRGAYIYGNYQPSNTYNASQTNLSAYISSELQITGQLKSIAGVRSENYNQYYTGVDQRGRLLDNKNIISSFKLFPSASFIFGLSESANVRASYARTIARPSFKEVSIAQIFDPLTGRTFIGGLRPVIISGDTIWSGNIRETDIDNFDLRFETFQSHGQTFSVSLFYKRFHNPLELVVFSESAPDNLQPRNLGDANVLGVELEMRKNLTFISPALDKFSVNINTSLMKSTLQMDKSRGGEYESRLNNAREGERIKDTRPMQGQAPYLINAGLSYADAATGWETGLFYNVQGKRLAIVGIGGVADVYDIPFHSLNYSLSKQFGKEKRSQLQFRVSNLLDDYSESRYQSHDSDDAVFQRLRPGRSFTLSYRYSL